MQTKEAIILAGGFGTRLQSVVQDIPKPMAPINHKPFLELLIMRLGDQDVNHIVLAVGYKYEVIQDYFGHNYKGIDISYAIESKPLGTGGAVVLATEKLKGPTCFVLNGDTMFDVSLAELEDHHFAKKADVTLALKEVLKQDRYGTVDLSKSRIISFNEKQYVEKGYINGGVYLLDKYLLSNLELPERFSLESDFFEKYFGDFNIQGCIQDSYFIDIGIPSDYAKAQVDLK